MAKHRDRCNITWTLDIINIDGQGINSPDPDPPWPPTGRPVASARAAGAPEVGAPAPRFVPRHHATVGLVPNTKF